MHSIDPAGAPRYRRRDSESRRISPGDEWVGRLKHALLATETQFPLQTDMLI
jgi:hypothetical protein